MMNEATINGVRMRFTFTETDDYSSFSPITQAWGVCFDSKGSIIIGKPIHHPIWMLPGGTIEHGETPEECLVREVDEEVSCTVKKYSLLGVQKVEYPNGEEEPHYQLRYACLVDVNTLTPDPAIDSVWKVKFIPAPELNDYLKWNNVGDKLTELAQEWYQSL